MADTTSDPEMQEYLLKLALSWMQVAAEPNEHLPEGGRLRDDPPPVPSFRRGGTPPSACSRCSPTRIISPAIRESPESHPIGGLVLELTLTMGRRAGPRCSRRGADITLQPVHLDELERQMKVAVIILNPTFLVFVQFVAPRFDFSQKPLIWPIDQQVGPS